VMANQPARKEEIPEESETIASKRTARLAEKIKSARNELKARRAWWSRELVEVFLLVLIFALNFYLIYPFFGTPASDTTFSGPVIPLLAKTIEFFGMPLSYSIQIVNIAFFLLFPISYYFFIRRISGRKMVAFLSLLFVSLSIYPFGETRIRAAFSAVDGPHIASLAIFPLALHGLLVFLREGGVRNLVIASVSSGLIALISPFGFIAFAIFASFSAFSEMLLGRGRLKLFRFLVVFVFAGGFNSFWYNPAFFYWMIIGPMGVEIRQMMAKLVPVSFFIVPALGAFGFLLFDRKPNLQPVFLASFYTIALGIIVLAGGGFFPSHPSRYAPEFGISLAFLLSIATIKLADYLRFWESPKPVFLRKVNKQFLANGALLLISLGLVLKTVLGRDSLIAENGNVLGFWTGVERGKIWIERDKFSGAPAFFGYVISGVSAFGLSFLGFKSRRSRLARSNLH
jgi:hypothetical protein